MSSKSTKYFIQVNTEGDIVNVNLPTSSYCFKCDKPITKKADELEIYCEECKQRMVPCFECGTVGLPDTFYNTNEGKQICGACLQTKYYNCTQCGVAHPKPDPLPDPSLPETKLLTDYCPECRKVWTICEACDGAVLKEQTYSYLEGDEQFQVLCPDCFGQITTMIKQNPNVRESAIKKMAQKLKKKDCPKLSMAFNLTSDRRSRTMTALWEEMGRFGFVPKYHDIHLCVVQNSENWLDKHAIGVGVVPKFTADMGKELHRLCGQFRYSYQKVTPKDEHKSKVKKGTLMLYLTTEARKDFDFVRSILDALCVRTK